MSEHDIDVREVVHRTKPSGTREIEIRMKVDDSYVIYQASEPNLEQGFTKAWDNPSVKPSVGQKAAAKRKGKSVVKERT